MARKIHITFSIITQILVKHTVLAFTTEKTKFNHSYRVI